jgi:hypothetical protein
MADKKKLRIPNKICAIKTDYHVGFYEYMTSMISPFRSYFQNENFLRKSSG